MTKQINEISYLRIATVQIPFIPVISHSDYNALCEPDGTLRYWLVGDNKTKVEIPLLFSLLGEKGKVLQENLQRDYMEWILVVIEDILGYLCRTENPDIILFPEYSLPWEISEDLKRIITKYSEKRCIIGGIGVGADGKNRCILVNNGKVEETEKIELSPYEKELKFIVEGNGPLLFPSVTLYPNGKKVNVPIVILICSDYYDEKSGGKVTTTLCKEIEEKRDGKWKDLIFLIPALSTDTKVLKPDIAISPPGKTDAGIKWRISVVSQASFFGESVIWHPPYPEIKGLNKGISPLIPKGKHGCIVADIPYPPDQRIVLKPGTKTIGVESDVIRKPNFGCRDYSISFNDESQAEGEGSIPVGVENFLLLVNDRLNKAITYTGVVSLGEIERLDKYVSVIKIWKALQKTVLDVFPNHDSNIIDIPDLLTPYLDTLVFADNPYEVIVDLLADLTDKDELRNCLHEVKRFILGKENEKRELPLHIWLAHIKNNK